jgi:hypothetical protein
MLPVALDHPNLTTWFHYGGILHQHLALSPPALAASKLFTALNLCQNVQVPDKYTNPVWPNKNPAIFRWGGSGLENRPAGAKMKDFFAQWRETLPVYTPHLTITGF